MSHSYVVVRCARSKTLELAKQLYGEHRIPAWTPRFEKRVRLPRKKIKRLVVKPLMPTFVFIREGYLERAEDLSQRRVVEEFSVMVVHGGRAVVREDELHEIASPIPEPDNGGDIPFAVGDRVTVGEGPLAGVSGKVISCQREYLEIETENFFGRVKIPPFVMRPA